MSQMNYNRSGRRIKQARLRRRLGSWGAPVLWGVIIVLVTAWLFALQQGSQLGWTALGLALLVLMAQLWNRWQLRNLPTTGSLDSPAVTLDQLIEAQLLSQLPWPATSDVAFTSAASTWEGSFILLRLGLPKDITLQILQQNPYDPWDQVVATAKQYNISEIDGAVVVAAILINAPGLDAALQAVKLGKEDVIAVLQWQHRLKLQLKALENRPVFGGVGRDWASGYTPLLNQYAQNLSQQVESGAYRHLPQIHEPVVDQLVELLSGNRANVALIGDAGAGKTALVYSLAERILKGDRAKSLQYNYILKLNASLLLSAGGQIEEVVMRLLAEAAHARNIILFLDEAQLFFGSGTGAVDLSQVLLPVLQQSPLKIIMTMAPSDWQHLSAASAGLAASIQRVTVPAPSPEDSLQVMADAANSIEAAPNLVTTYQAIKEAYSLADRYLPESAFPGKGISLIESASHYTQQGFITQTSVQQAVETMTGAKITAAETPEKQQLLNLEDEIHKRMVNQSRAVTVVSDALRRARAGVRNQNRPVGSFLFLGPTGVGKTELARALADVYFGGQNQIIRVDMSEYQQPKDTDRLLAPGAGSRTGSSLIGDIRHQPFSVVLFDEIEKAHPDVLNLLLQLLDEGRLTDTQGREASFKDAIIISTSNAAADVIRQKIEAGQELVEFEDEIVSGLIESHQFRPELLNRFDEIVLFRPLNKAELRQVVELMLRGVNATLAAQKISVSLTAAAIDWLVDRGYDPRLGARPMRRMVQRAVENTIAQRILSGQIQPGASVTLDAADLHVAD
ncbi:ATP-dependent Clp protease ATP-binding subunit [Patescibacteria group bacterium]|nr:MAG: ATP-dependent Clp protease ATP-binding subunit [Patescibacteria group bacterium]